MTLPAFYPIVPDVTWVQRLVPLGVKMLQLRIKNTPAADIATQIKKASALCDEHNVILVVNDYWRLALEIGAPWVHLGQEDLDTADIDAIRSAGIKLGVSTHDTTELERALALHPDYVALGPVYPTTTKKMRWHSQGLDKVTEWKTRIGDIPLVAIGGITLERAPGVLAAGADVVSLISDITGADNPEHRIKQWLEATE